MKKIISIVLALLLLGSTSGLTYAQHYCGSYKMLEEITIGQKYLSCGMALEDDGCEDDKKEEHSCCDNNYIAISTDDAFAKASFDIDFKVQFLATFVEVFVLQKHINTKQQETHFKDYSPPPIIEDLPILYETFLI